MAVDPISIDVRAAPTSAFIAAVREKYPVEPEIDYILSRKMANRHRQGYSDLSLKVLSKGVEDLIQSEIGSDFVLSNPRWLPGGFSKIQMAFDLDWRAPDSNTRQRAAMVLRMEPSESIVETSRRREFELLQLIKKIIPAAPTYWLDADGKYLPYPGLIYGFVPGIATPAGSAQQVNAGITAFNPSLRAALSSQFVAHLAAIHTIDAPTLTSLKYFAHPKVGSNESVIHQINWWRRVWEEDRPENVPLIDIGAQWLIENAPPLDHVSLIHGDFRAGNFLFTEADARITAWLDWELAVLGDRHQDLTWATGPLVTRYAEDGCTPLVCGLLPKDDFFKRYEKESGLPVDPKRLTYYRVFTDFISAIHMLGTAWRVAHHGKTDKDVIVAWISMIGNIGVSKLRETLEEVL